MAVVRYGFDGELYEATLTEEEFAFLQERMTAYVAAAAFIMDTMPKPS